MIFFVILEDSICRLFLRNQHTVAGGIYRLQLAQGMNIQGLLTEVSLTQYTFMPLSPGYHGLPILSC